MLILIDASDNVISGNEPSSEMLTSQSQIHEIFICKLEKIFTLSMMTFFEK